MSDEYGAEHQHHHLRTPTRELPHAEKVKRQERHVEILSLVLLLVLAMLIYAAIFDLDHWAEWIVFGGIIFTAIGAGVAVNTHDRA